MFRVSTVVVVAASLQGHLGHLDIAQKYFGDAAHGGMMTIKGVTQSIKDMSKHLDKRKVSLEINDKSREILNDNA